MPITRTVYYALHHKPDQPYPLHSGAPFLSLERARLECQKLVKQGYCGWILRLRETRQADWPNDHWLIDHSVDDAISWIERRFSRRQITSQSHPCLAAFLKAYGWFVFRFVRVFPRRVPRYTPRLLWG